MPFSLSLRERAGVRVALHSALCILNSSIEGPDHVHIPPRGGSGTIFARSGIHLETVRKRERHPARIPSSSA